MWQCINTFCLHISALCCVQGHISCCADHGQAKIKSYWYQTKRQTVELTVNRKNPQTKCRRQVLLRLSLSVKFFPWIQIAHIQNSLELWKRGVGSDMIGDLSPNFFAQVREKDLWPQLLLKAGAELSACEMSPLMHPCPVELCPGNRSQSKWEKEIISEREIELDGQIIRVIMESHAIAPR